eukprot:221582-Chlamydomonas_euryale.AAC.2
MPPEHAATTSLNAATSYAFCVGLVSSCWLTATQSIHTHVSSAALRAFMQFWVILRFFISLSGAHGQAGRAGGRSSCWAIRQLGGCAIGWFGQLGSCGGGLEWAGERKDERVSVGQARHAHSQMAADRWPLTSGR